MFRLDFDYLNELPILVLDVDDDFKNDRIKQEEIIDKVGAVSSSSLVFRTVCCRRLIVSLSLSAGQRVSLGALTSSANHSKPQGHLIGYAFPPEDFLKFLSLKIFFLLRSIFMDTIMFCYILSSLLRKTCL